MNPNPAEFQDAAAPGPGEASRGPLELICAALGKGPVNPGREWHQRSGRGFLQAAETHGVGALLDHALASSGLAGEWPDEIREALAESGRRELAREAIRVQELRRLLAAMDAERMVPVMLDGSALAYSVYPTPHVRSRDSTHLLVRRAAVADIVQILGQLGYRRHHRLPGQRVLHEDTYLREDDSGDTHAFNLHWAVDGRSAGGQGLDYADIRRRAVAIEALSPFALGACREDLLLHACLRRRARAGGETLIGLYDIHLLVESMAAVDFQRFVRAALDKGMGQAARDAIAQARRGFDTRLPCGGLEDHFSTEKLDQEAGARIRLSPGRRFLKRLAGLGRLERARHAFALTPSQGLPPPAQSGEGLRARPFTWLPALHLRHALKGIIASLKRAR